MFFLECSHNFMRHIHVASIQALFLTCGDVCSLVLMLQDTVQKCIKCIQCFVFCFFLSNLLCCSVKGRPHTWTHTRFGHFIGLWEFPKSHSEIASPLFTSFLKKCLSDKLNVWVSYCLFVLTFEVQELNILDLLSLSVALSFFCYLGWVESVDVFH